MTHINHCAMISRGMCCYLIKKGAKLIIHYRKMKTAHAINFQQINYTSGCSKAKTFITAACYFSEKLGRFARVALYNIFKAAQDFMCLMWSLEK